MNPMEIRRRNENLRNRPHFMPGQSDDEDDTFYPTSSSFDDDDDSDDFFGGGMGRDTTPRFNGNAAPNPFSGPRGGFPFDSPMNNSMNSMSGGFGNPMGAPMTAGPQGMPNGGMRQPDNRSVEDKFWDGAAAVGKTAKTFLQAVQECIQGRDYISLIKGSKAVLISSAACAICSLVFMVLHMFLPIFGNWFGMLIGSGLSMVIGFLGYALWLDKAEEEDRLRQNQPEPMSRPVMPRPVMPQPAFNRPMEEPENDEPDFEDIDFGSFESEDPEPEPEPEPVPQAVPVEQAINEIPFVDPHTQTRSFLYEQYCRVLPRMSPKFYEMKPIDSSSTIFNECQNYLNIEAESQGISEDQWPVITNMFENGFLYQIQFESGLKTLREKSTLYAESVAKQMSYDNFGRRLQKYDGMYGQGFTIGNTIILKIFKGKASDSRVSLGDCLALSDNKDFVLDLENKMPIFYGVNEQGNLNRVDFLDNECFAVSGEMRSGKSFQAQSILAQMCMWTSPKDLIIEVMDVKGGSSDYTIMFDNLPHFRTFRCDPKGIVERLAYLVDTEGARRNNLLRENGCQNIKDLHKYKPDIYMPYLYVVVDEMQGLMKALEIYDMELAGGKKNTKEFTTRYRGYLERILTQLPNTGIRLFMVPHIFKDQIIPKTVYTLCNCKQCCRTSKDDLKNTLGITEKSFPYSLVLPGDMAIQDKQIMQGNPVYNHGLMISNSNIENKPIYKFIGSVWQQFEPDYKPHLEQITHDAIVNHNYIDIDYGKELNINKLSSNSYTYQNTEINSYSQETFSNQLENNQNQNNTFGFDFSDNILDDSMFDDMSFD